MLTHYNRFGVHYHKLTTDQTSIRRFPNANANDADAPMQPRDTKVIGKLVVHARHAGRFDSLAGTEEENIRQTAMRHMKRKRSDHKWTDGGRRRSKQRG